jgi:acyl-CoA thioester hydrolase
MSSPFTITIRVYYEDTDVGGIVYHANYLKFMERARTEWLRSLGVEQDELARRHRVMFAVRSARIEFLKPARFNDVIQVDAALVELGGASLTIAQTLRCADVLLCEGEFRVACLDASSFVPRAFPDDLAARLKEVRP